MTTSKSSPNLEDIFEELKQILSKYSKNLVEANNVKAKKAQYLLWSPKEVEIAGRKRQEVFFAGIIQQKNFVGFYFMPIYGDENIHKVIAPELLKTLKGKSCFHIKHLTPNLKKEIKTALDIGYKLYKKRDWI